MSDHDSGFAIDTSVLDAFRRASQNLTHAAQRMMRTFNGFNLYEQVARRHVHITYNVLAVREQESIFRYNQRIKVERTEGLDYVKAYATRVRQELGLADSEPHDDEDVLIYDDDDDLFYEDGDDD